MSKYLETEVKNANLKVIAKNELKAVHKEEMNLNSQYEIEHVYFYNDFNSDFIKVYFIHTEYRNNFTLTVFSIKKFHQFQIHFDLDFISEYINTDFVSKRDFNVNFDSSVYALNYILSDVC